MVCLKADFGAPLPVMQQTRDLKPTVTAPAFCMQIVQELRSDAQLSFAILTAPVSCAIMSPSRSVQSCLQSTWSLPRVVKSSSSVSSQSSSKPQCRKLATLAAFKAPKISNEPNVRESSSSSSGRGSAILTSASRNITRRARKADRNLLERSKLSSSYHHSKYLLSLAESR